MICLAEEAPKRGAPAVMASDPLVKGRLFMRAATLLPGPGGDEVGERDEDAAAVVGRRSSASLAAVAAA